MGIYFLISVSLRSIIHSYLDLELMYKTEKKNFRLLAEYHSFLLTDSINEDVNNGWISVSLWSIIHSYFQSLSLLDS